jgi:ABC-type multidrug transport system fused ATPase/permease subunit
MVEEKKLTKEQTKAQMRAGLRAIARHMRPFKVQVTLLIVLGFISALANGVVPYVTGRFFDALIGVSNHATGMFSEHLPLWAGLLIIWAIAQLIANNIDWIMDRLRRKLDNGVHFKMQVDGFVHMFRLPMNYHKNAHTNGELQKIGQAGWRVSAILGNITQIGPQLLSILIGIILAATINMMLAGVLLVGVILYVIMLVRILIPIAAIDAKAHKSWNESWDDAAASIQQIESVKQASAESYEIKKVSDNLLGTVASLWYRLERVWSNVEFFQRTIVFLTQLTVFFLSVKLVAGGVISVGELVALNGYSLMFFGPFVALGHSWQTIQNGITAAARAEEIFDQKEEVYKPQGAATLATVTGDIRFDHVSFRYGPEQPEILSDIDLEIKPGQVIALVGESGVGKSTTISLISGYYFPTQGSVHIDGIDTRKLDLTSLRQQIGVVPQEVALFNDTLMANIRYGTFGASEADVLRAAKEAHMEDFISALPHKYETIVGERGIKLSVGQKQRVAIARAILRNPSILILDEPTSALDAQTEQIVTGALEKLMHGKTTFIIAHRLSTVRKADMVLVFQKGKIVEKGTHNELVAKEGGVYRRLYDYQIGLH